MARCERRRCEALCVRLVGEQSYRALWLSVICTGESMSVLYTANWCMPTVQRSSHCTMLHVGAVASACAQSSTACRKLEVDRGKGSPIWQLSGAPYAHIERCLQFRSTHMLEGSM